MTDKLKPGEDALEEKQEFFCQEFLIDLNQRQAYIRAGYNPKNADNCASKLMRKPKVRARIDQLLAQRSKRTGVTQDRVVRELARVAFVDPTKVIDFASGDIKPEATEDDHAALAGVRIKDTDMGTEREIKMHDKVRALEMLGKHLGMFTDNVAMNVSLPVIVDNVPDKQPEAIPNGQ